MKFVQPTADELSALRADVIIFEQELDLRPEMAEALERVLGFRAGRAYWLSGEGHLFAVELGDFGRGRPSMAIVSAFWPRYEPRPLDDDAIDAELVPFLLWLAEITEGLDPADIQWTLDRSARPRPPLQGQS